MDEAGVAVGQLGGIQAWVRGALEALGDEQAADEELAGLTTGEVRGIYTALACLTELAIGMARAAEQMAASPLAHMFGLAPQDAAR